MSETGDTMPAPPETDYAIVYHRKQTNSDRSIKALEAITLLPDTFEGLQASETIMDLIEQLHRARLDSIEQIFTSVRTIFQSFRITLDI